MLKGCSAGVVGGKEVDNIILSQQKFYCDKHVFVITKHIFCRDKIFVIFAATNVLSQETQA